MSITERDRRNLFDGLEQTLGPDQAETLMKMLPDQPADELVTIPYLQTEMAAGRAEARAEFGEFRSEMRTEFADFRSEMRRDFTAFRTEMRTEFADFRSEMRSDFNDFRTETQTDFSDFRVEMRGEIAEVKGTVLQVENALTLRIADLQADVSRWQSSMNRWAMGLAAANVASVLTAFAA